MISDNMSEDLSDDDLPLGGKVVDANDTVSSISSSDEEEDEEPANSAQKEELHIGKGKTNLALQEESLDNKNHENKTRKENLNEEKENINKEILNESRIKDYTKTENSEVKSSRKRKRNTSAQKSGGSVTTE